MAEYTDDERIAASQIAYSDEINYGYQVLHAEYPERDSFTVEECLEAAVSCPDSAWCNPRYENVDDYFAAENNLLSDEQRDWRIAAVYDNNSGMSRTADSENISGFYACIIETGQGQSDAIIAFRGSESAADVNQLQRDWMEADLGLLNSTGTNQYRDAERFLQDNRERISRYGSIELTGHSLGGNLAEFSAIIAARYGLGSNFTRCTSLDGPGFSNEFLAAYENEIAGVSDRLYRIKWSLVGSLLHDVPGETIRFGRVSDDISVYANPFGRHSLESLETENGMIPEGKQDFVALLGQGFSRLVDDLPAPVGDTLVHGIQTLVMYCATMTDAEKKGWAALFIMTTVATGGTNLVVLTAAALKVVGAALLVYAVYLGYEVIQRIWDELVDAARTIAENVWNWAKEKVAEFVAGLVQIRDQLLDAIRSVLPSGIRANQYLSAHHVIRLHTDDLRSLASRLDSVNSRLRSLDSRINGLYRLAKLTDLRELLTCVSADLRICYSSRLRNCADYLNSTAEWFEEAERELSGMF